MYKPGFKFILILLTHLLIIFNVNFLYSDEKIDQLKIGLLVPLSGDYKEIGKSMIFSSALAIKEIDDKDVELLPSTVIERTGIAIKQGQYITVIADGARISATAWGVAAGDPVSVTPIPTA